MKNIFLIFLICSQFKFLMVHLMTIVEYEAKRCVEGYQKGTRSNDLATILVSHSPLPRTINLLTMHSCYIIVCLHFSLVTRFFQLNDLPTSLYQ